MRPPRGSPRRATAAERSAARQLERDLDQPRLAARRRGARRSPRAPRARCRPCGRAPGPCRSAAPRTAARRPRRPRRSRGRARPTARAVGHERAGAGLDVHHQPVEPLGELLGEDRGDDQRDRLDGAGGVAQRVEAAVGGGEVGGLADDRAAGLGDGRAQPVELGRGGVAGDRVELVERAAGVARARGPRSSARSAPQAASSGARMSDTLSPTPPVECLSSTGPSRSQASTVPESRIAVVSVTRSRGSRSRKKTAIANAAAWPSLTPPSAMPCDEEARAPRRRARRRRACGGSAPGRRRSSRPHPAPQQRAELGGAALALLERLLVRERHLAHALGEVRDRRRPPRPAGRSGARRSPRARCSCRRGRRRACGTRGSRRASRSSGR